MKKAHGTNQIEKSKISTAISIKHRIMATFNIEKKSILTACMPLMCTIVLIAHLVSFTKIVIIIFFVLKVLFDRLTTLKIYG
jgi:hypothetical protein